jgi:phage baseplate assembly protein V
MINLVRTIITRVAEGVIKRFSGTGRPGEDFNSREYFQHYGFTSRPLQGSEGLALVHGNVVYLIASDDRRYRLALADGEVALYTDEGDYIHFQRGRTLKAYTGGTLNAEAGREAKIIAPQVTVEATEQAKVTAPQVEINASTGVTINGRLTLIGDLVQTGNQTVTGNIAASGTIMDVAGNTPHHEH